MKLVSVIAGWFKKIFQPKESATQRPKSRIKEDHGINYDFTCSHIQLRARRNYVVMILGVKCKIERSSMCPTCTERYLNRYSTLCASCLKPIFPGTSVGLRRAGSLWPYTHMARSCCIARGNYCGLWGQGRLRSLHELFPEEPLPEIRSLK